MYYHLSDHIYITQFREEYIILDTKKDKYTVCFEQLSKLFSNIFEKNKLHSKKGLPISDSAYSSQDLGYIQTLLDNDVIENKETPYPFYIDQKPHSDGVANVDWRLPLKNESVDLSSQVLNAFMTLIRINFYIKAKGLYSTIQFIKKSRKNDSCYIIPQEKELQNLANIVNKACLMYPTRTKCLEWAMTFVLLALKRGWKCNLEIGVQNYPFMAHAWVECNGKVVMDSQDLRERLAIILNEPFRKKKL